LPGFGLFVVLVLIVLVVVIVIVLVFIVLVEIVVELETICKKREKSGGTRDVHGG